VSVSFFVSFSSFLLFSRVFWRLSSVLLTVLPLQLLPHSPSSPLSLVAFICPSFTLLAGDEWGLLPYPHSPSFALLADDEEGRLSCRLWLGFLSVFSGSSFFSFFSLALKLFPPRFALMVMCLVAKKSQSSNGPPQKLNWHGSS
jgi:hypothetical protein